MQLTISESGPASSVDESFALCERLARAHYENFSVATRLLPARLRRHFYSVYAFCRGVDDLGDEAAGGPMHRIGDRAGDDSAMRASGLVGEELAPPEPRARLASPMRAGEPTERVPGTGAGVAPADNLRHLAEWERQLRLCYTGTPTHPYFVALQHTITTFDIPAEPFLKLIEANRRDQRIKLHPTYDELLEYCDHSANPVGRIVLYVLGQRDPELHRLSDHTCTALQLANFWQDVARDYAIGRIYLPAEDLRRFGCAEQDIGASRATPQFRALLKFEVQRARELFRLGIPLIDRVQNFARVDIALFTAGGLSILKLIEKQDYDVLSRRPALSRWAKARLFAMVILRTRLGMKPLPSGLLS